MTPKQLEAKGSDSIIFQAEPGDWVASGGQELPLVNTSKDGALVVGFHRRSPQQRAGKKLRCCISHDGGTTWEATDAVPNGLVLDEGNGRHMRPTVPNDGTLLIAGHWAWVEFPEAKRRELAIQGYRIDDETQGYRVYDEAQGNKPGIISVFYPLWMRRSRDSGRTWTITEILVSPLISWSACSRHGEGILLGDGTFVEPFWGRGTKDFASGASEMENCVVLRSEDGGDSWDVHSIVKDVNRAFIKPCVAEAANGELVAAFQPIHAEEDHLWTAVSADGGRTWSPPVETPIRGAQPWLVTTTEDLLVAVYIRDNPALFPESTGTFACVSKDHGQSWDVEREITLWNNQGKWFDCHTSAIALDDASVYAVYVRKGKRVLAGIRFYPGSMT